MELSFGEESNAFGTHILLCEVKVRSGVTYIGCLTSWVGESRLEKEAMACYSHTPM